MQKPDRVGDIDVPVVVGVGGIEAGEAGPSANRYMRVNMASAILRLPSALTGGLRQSCAKPELRGHERKMVERAINYMDRNQEYMAEYTGEIMSVPHAGIRNLVICLAVETPEPGKGEARLRNVSTSRRTCSIVEQV